LESISADEKYFLIKHADTESMEIYTMQGEFAYQVPSKPDVDTLGFIK
jgi:hypothetical protein